MSKRNSLIHNRLEHILEFSDRVASEKPTCGFVYMIQAGEFVKIGLTDNVARRLLSLQTGNPEPLVLLKSWPTICPAADEKHIHQTLKRFWIRGEWFKLPVPVISKLVRLNGIRSISPSIFD